MCVRLEEVSEADSLVSLRARRAAGPCKGLVSESHMLNIAHKKRRVSRRVTDPHAGWEHLGLVVLNLWSYSRWAPETLSPSQQHCPTASDNVT